MNVSNTSPGHKPVKYNAINSMFSKKLLDMGFIKVLPPHKKHQAQGLNVLDQRYVTDETLCLEIHSLHKEKELCQSHPKKG